MMKYALLLLFSASLHAAQLTPIVVSPGSNGQGGGDFFPAACDGNIYKLVEKVINGYVKKAYLFIASPAPAIDAWLYTDAGQIIGEVHRVVATHQKSGLNYWERERDFGNDSVWVGKVWILVMCYPSGAPTSIEPYAIIYTRGVP